MDVKRTTAEETTTENNNKKNQGKKNIPQMKNCCARVHHQNGSFIYWIMEIDIPDTPSFDHIFQMANTKGNSSFFILLYYVIFNAFRISYVRVENVFDEDPIFLYAYGYNLMKTNHFVGSMCINGHMRRNMYKWKKNKNELGMTRTKDMTGT